MIRGRIITDSLRVGADVHVPELRLVRIGRHDVSASTLPADERRQFDSEHGAVDGQPTTWTFLDFEAPDSRADDLAHALANAIEPNLGWWADFTINDAEHVIVFAHRTFRYRIGDGEARDAAVAWGRSVGTPEHQLDCGA